MANFDWTEKHVEEEEVSLDMSRRYFQTKLDQKDLGLMNGLIC